MPGFVVSGLLLVLALAAAAHAVLARRRASRLSSELVALRHAAAARDRGLGLLAREMQSLGLSLLGHAGTAEAGPTAEPLAKGATRLLDLSDDLDELLAVKGGQRSLRAEPLPLLPVLEDAVAATAAQLGPARRDWRVAPECGAITLRADARALRGALEQVLTRAARSTRDGDWIGVRPVVTPDSVAILVEDEGAGLPAADVAPESAAAPAAGTRGLGFGLAVARALLEAHGGSLRVEAVRGVGARAWLCLPRERLLAA